MVVQHNLLAMNANRMYGITSNRQGKLTEKLSSGYKINRAADDAACLAISEKMRRQVRGLTQASLNVQDGISFVQTADGALDEVQDMLQRINELAVKSSNGTNDESDRKAIDQEVQNLKAEINRVLGTTTFNDRLIWDTEAAGKRIIDYEPVPAVSLKENEVYSDLSNENIDEFPNGGIKVNASKADGVSFSWKGMDGNTYKTGSISLEKLKEKNYSVKLSSLYGDATSNGSPVSLYTSSGTPLFDGTFSFSIAEVTTEDELVNSINGANISTTAGVGYTPEWESTAGRVQFYNWNLNLSAAYASYKKNETDAFSFDAGNDNVIKPKYTADGGNMTSYPTATTVEEAKNDTKPLSFQFEMSGLGTVTATINSASYEANDRSDASENIFWRWVRPYKQTPWKTEKSISISPDLKGVMDALTGDLSDSTPGLLEVGNGGTIYFSMSLSAGGTAVGSQSFSMRVSSSDTEESIFNAFKNSFNKNTILDYNITNSNVNGDNAKIYNWQRNINIVQQPIYQATNDFFVHSGSEAEDEIHILYDSLSTYTLGISKTSVDTVENSKAAIDSVKKALAKVSEERSDFGAYQNRLEHTVANLNNVVENTTAAESSIRDTDMAKSMVEYANNNILAQAGVSMLAQANQSAQSVMGLLG